MADLAGDPNTKRQAKSKTGKRKGDLDTRELQVARQRTIAVFWVVCWFGFVLLFFLFNSRAPRTLHSERSIRSWTLCILHTAYQIPGSRKDHAHTPLAKPQIHNGQAAQGESPAYPDPAFFTPPFETHANARGLTTAPPHVLRHCHVIDNSAHTLFPVLWHLT